MTQIPDRLLLLCQLFTQQLIDNKNLLSSICFWMKGHLWWSKYSYQSALVYGNPHTTSSKINVWAGLLGNHIVLPFFIDGNLNGAKKYHWPIITEIVGHDDNFIENQLLFHHDGVPPHYAVFWSHLKPVKALNQNLLR